jgi:hypothetical protein
MRKAELGAVLGMLVDLLFCLWYTNALGRGFGDLFSRLVPLR